MKRLTMFATFLLITALLCGCMAANPGNTVPTDAPTTPTTTPTQPTEPQPTDPPPTEPKPLEPLRFQSDSGHGSYPALTRAGKYCAVARSKDQLCYLADISTTQMDPKYDDAFFEENSVILFSCAHGNGMGQNAMFVSNIVELGENRYEVVVDHYDHNPYNCALDYHHACVEVNRVLDEDAEVTVKFRSYSLSSRDAWNLITEEEDEVDYSLPGEPVPFHVTKMDWNGAPSSKRPLQSVAELAEAYGGKIPEELSKYDESFFAEHSLFLAKRAKYMEFSISDVSCMADGNYVIRGEYISHKDTVPEGEPTQYDLYVVEIDGKIPEDVQFIYLQARIDEFDLDEGPYNQ